MAILDSARVAQPPTSWLSTTRSLKRLSRETVAASTDASSLGVSERTTAAPGPGAEAILMMLAVVWKAPRWSSHGAIGRLPPRVPCPLQCEFI